jgi:hypothetical protein
MEPYLMSSLPGFKVVFLEFFYNNVNPFGFFRFEVSGKINGFDPLPEMFQVMVYRLSENVCPKNPKGFGNP